jgi:hypothetical protein
MTKKIIGLSLVLVLLVGFLASFAWAEEGYHLVVSQVSWLDKPSQMMSASGECVGVRLNTPLRAGLAGELRVGMSPQVMQIGTEMINICRPKGASMTILSLMVFGGDEYYKDTISIMWPDCQKSKSPK